jgi:uncharacterized protein YecE (DUF72 family)
LSNIRIGTSGWKYKEWRGKFYPEGLRQRDELEYVADRFDSLEVNGSFYGLISAETWRGWNQSVTKDFRFAVKGSRFITHNKKLGDVETPLANFFASGVLELGAKLGPILWQLPASMRFEASRIEDFFALLPRDSHDAVDLAKRHDSRVKNPSHPTSDRRHRIRHAFEFRHESFLTDEMARIAKRHGVALAFSHSSEWPYVEQLTAGFVYLRLHGPSRLYASRYHERLGHWAERVKTWSMGESPEDANEFSSVPPPSRTGRDVYVYFDNDHRGYAPAEATKLRRLLSLG